MCGGNPFKELEEEFNNAVDNVKSGVKNINDELTEVGRDVGGGLENIGRWYAGGQVGDIKKGVGEITGRNAYEKGMRETAERQEAESNRLIWERDNTIAQNKEMDMQAEARKRLKASAAGGRAGTILTGFTGDAGSTALGQGGGTNILGA